MADFIISYNATAQKAIVQLDGDAVPAGYTEIGNFSDDDSGTLGSDNSVAFNRIRDALFILNGPGGITDMSKISIHMAPQTVVVSPATATLDAEDTVELVGTISVPYNSFGADDITWTSDDEAVATVDEFGVVTAVATGSAIITATTDISGKTDTAAITVS